MHGLQPLRRFSFEHAANGGRHRSSFWAPRHLIKCVGLNREEKAEDVTEENRDHVFDVNVKSAMFQAQAAARHMIRLGSVRSLPALRGRGYSACCAVFAVT
jgi:NAD(P)-dependent dehydrogenase (short-subunit alcohol dehydrogenase family)